MSSAARTDSASVTVTSPLTKALPARSALLALGLGRVPQVRTGSELPATDASTCRRDERRVGFEPGLLDELRSGGQHACGVLLDGLAALLEGHLERRREEHRGERTDSHADEERERDVTQGSRTEQERTDEEDRTHG